MRNLDTFLKTLEVHTDPYIDFIVRRPRRWDRSEAGHLVEVDAPVLPETEINGRIDTRTGTSLPGGEVLFYCRAETAYARALFEAREFRRSFLAGSWVELWESKLEECFYVFGLRFEERSLDGRMSGTVGKFSELYPGLQPKGVTTPPHSGGVPPPALELSEEHLTRFMPQPPVKDGKVADYPLTENHAFFFANVGFDLDGRSHLELDGGATWWSSEYFPASEEVFQAFRNESHGDPSRPFNGVLLIPHASNAHGVEAKREDLQLAITKVGRLRLLLNVLHDAVPYVVAHYSVLGERRQARTIDRMVHRGIRYRHRTPRYWVRRKCHQAGVLEEASRVAFQAPRSKKDLLGFVQRAADSLDLSRELTDRPIAQVLGWAAVEALVSPSDKQDLIASMIITLLGMPSHESLDAGGFWKDAKASYRVRSNIVHSFGLPEAKDLTTATDFVQSQAEDVLRYAIRVALPRGIRRVKMGSELRERALARMNGTGAPSVDHEEL